MACRPDRIVLELTERESIRDPERLRTVLLGVQDAGVRIAADDVGAGNAGLRLLSQFRFDVVKIDLSLVQRGGNDSGQSVLRSIVEVAAADGRDDDRRGRSRRPASCARPAASGSRRARATCSAGLARSAT